MISPPDTALSRFATVVAVMVLFPLAARPTWSQRDGEPGKKKPRKPEPEFNWVSPSPEGRLKSLGVSKLIDHGTFRSPSMERDVGYYIYLPPGYGEPANARVEYPVVYHLHGGRPGGEYKSIAISRFVDEAIRRGEIGSTIYVFPNGGPMSWYNYPRFQDGQGEDVFVKELIPHIDATYRTRGKEGRAIEGFSQGGRGTTRIMFRYPAHFASAAPGGSGYEPEKRIQEHRGVESENVVFAEGYNAWDLARVYADSGDDRPRFPIRLWVGSKGFNYEFNLKYSAYLDELGIEHDTLIAQGVDHSAQRFYEKRGKELMQWHQANFEKASKRR